MPLEVSKIQNGLRFLREADHKHKVFGADGHEYNLRACLKEAEIIEFENHHGLRLPEDYRTFLRELGNGGAGPFYGINGLDELYETTEDYWNDLSKPFPYRHQWKGPPELLNAIKEATGDEWDAE